MYTRVFIGVGSGGQKIVALALLLLSSAFFANAQTSFTNVEVVNVTPQGFSIAAAVSRTTLTATNIGLNVFADSAGATSLNGQVGVELYPLNSGDPKATNQYQTFLSKSALRSNSMGQGLVYARVSLCSPATTYYYQIAVTNASGQAAFYPSNGPLPSVTTALENSFVLQSEQLLITVNDGFPPGSIITLANSNTPSLLAAVVGDGAGNNQVFFNVNDLISASGGGTNFAPLGTQVFTASVLGHSTNSLTQTFSLLFTTNFSVGQFGSGVLGQLGTTIIIGYGAVQTGTTGSIPITLNSQSAVVGLSFVLNFPTNLFTSITLQPSIGAVGTASVTPLSSNSVLLNLSASSGNNLLGNQQIAQLNLAAISNQPSAFIPIVAKSPAGTNADASLAADFSLQSGRVAIVGQQPLLELQHSGANLALDLYGIPGNTYEIQSSTNNLKSWTNFALVPMGSLSQTFNNLDRLAPSVFFRAYSFNADPPIIQTVPGMAQRSLLVYGVPGTNYTLLRATSLPGVWSPVTNYTLTNSFLYLTNLGNSAPIFYRLQR